MCGVCGVLCCGVVCGVLWCAELLNISLNSSVNSSLNNSVNCSLKCSLNCSTATPRRLGNDSTTTQQQHNNNTTTTPHQHSTNNSQQQHPQPTTHQQLTPDNTSTTHNPQATTQQQPTAHNRTTPTMCKHYTKPTHTSHSTTLDFTRVAQDLSHRVNRNRCVSQNSRSHIQHSMSHTLSLLFPSHLSTTSFSTCTPVRLSIRLSTRLSLLSTSHGDLPCVDPSNVSFAPWRKRTGLQVMSPKFSLKSTPLQPMFFHTPSMTSTCHSAESIAIPPPESDLDEQIRNMLASPL